MRIDGTLLLGIGGVLAWQAGLLAKIGIPAPANPFVPPSILDPIKSIVGGGTGSTGDGSTGGNSGSTCPLGAPADGADPGYCLPSPNYIRTWAKSLGVAPCQGFEFVEGYSRLPKSLPEFEEWRNRTGRNSGICFGPGSGWNTKPATTEWPATPMTTAPGSNVRQPYPPESTVAPY